MISFLYLLPGRVGVEDWQERKHKEDNPWVATPSFSSWYPKKVIATLNPTAIRRGDGSGLKLTKQYVWLGDVLRFVAKQCFQIVWDSGVAFLNSIGARTKLNP